MSMHVEKIGEVAVVEAPGEELDAGNAPDFKIGMAPVLESSTRVVLDMRRLRFVDSSGLGAILSCMRQLAAKGGELKLCGLSEAVRSIFELVRMHRVFDIHDTPEEAIEAFRR
ncbi:MAG: STAS domain-containing protein [Bryobacteraceae bacterium]